MIQNFINPIPKISIKKARRYFYPYLDISHDGKRSRFHIGCKVLSSQWCIDKQRAYTSTLLSNLDNLNNKIANEKIEAYIKRYTDFINYLCEYPEKINKFHEELKAYMARPRKKPQSQQDKIDVFKIIEHAVTNKDKNNDKTRYNYIGKGLKAFKAFSDSRDIPISNFDMINTDLIYEFKEFLESGHYTNNGKPYAMSSLNSIIKYAVGAIKCLPVAYMPKSKAKTICVPQLTDKTSDKNEIGLRDCEVIKLSQYKPESKRDEEILDMFLILCLTGQRVSDLKKIGGGVEMIQGVPCLKLVQDKTSHKLATDIIFPLLTKILNKYEHLPTSDITKKINKNIGRIAKDAGISGSEQISKHYLGSDKPITTKVDRTSLIKSHTGRRTFVSILSVHGWTYERIGKYTGQILKVVEHYDKSTSIDKRIYMESPQHERLEVIGDTPTQRPQTIERYPNNVENARKVLSFLGVKSDSTDIGELLGMIAYREHNLLARCDGRIDIIAIKDLFNTDASLEKRSAALKIMVNGIYEIKNSYIEEW